MERESVKRRCAVMTTGVEGWIIEGLESGLVGEGQEFEICASKIKYMEMFDIWKAIDLVLSVHYLSLLESAKVPPWIHEGSESLINPSDMVFFVLCVATYFQRMFLLLLR